MSLDACIKTLELTLTCQKCHILISCIVSIEQVDKTLQAASVATLEPREDVMLEGGGRVIHSKLDALDKLCGGYMRTIASREVSSVVVPKYEYSVPERSKREAFNELMARLRALEINKPKRGRPRKKKMTRRAPGQVSDLAARLGVSRHAVGRALKRLNREALGA